MLVIKESERVAHLAPPEDAAEAQLLIDHEVGFIDFAAACRAGDPRCTDVLTALLDRVAVLWCTLTASAE